VQRELWHQDERDEDMFYATFTNLAATCVPVVHGPILISIADGVSNTPYYTVHPETVGSVAVQAPKHPCCWWRQCGRLPPTRCEAPLRVGAAESGAIPQPLL